MKFERPDEPTGIGDPLAKLERALIDEFLERRGYNAASLQSLPQDVANSLLREASIHASARLTEVESRAHYVHDLHGPASEAGSGGKHRTTT